jgi:putative spermidine/putrescine transport system permease protein
MIMRTRLGWLIWAMVFFDLMFLALPTVVIVIASFTGGNMVAFPPEGFSLRWYGALVEERAFTSALLRSLWIGLVCTLISVPAGTLAAITLARHRFRHDVLIQIYLLLPFIVPLIVSGLGLMLIFGWLRLLGQLWPVGLAACIINLPFMIWAVAASVNALDPDLEDAAAGCGAPPLTTFMTVTLPAVMPGVITGALLMFILALNEFIVSLLLVDARIVTLPVLMYNSIRAIITPDLAALSVVYIAIALVSIWLLDRLVGLEIFLRSK